MPREIWIWQIFALSSNFGRILKQIWWIIYWGVVETLVKPRGREDFGKHFARTPLTCDAMLGGSWHLTIGCCRGKGKRRPKFRIQIKSMLRTPRTTFRTNSVPQLGHGCHDQQNLWSGFWWTLILFCINGTLLLMMVMWMAVSCPVLHSMWVVWMQLPPPTSNWTSHRMHRWSSCEKYNFELAKKFIYA